MTDAEFIIKYSTRSVFLLENILFLYVFLTPGRLRFFQLAAFVITWVIAYIIRHILMLFIPDPLLISYIIGCLYLIPCVLIFKETIQAKIFVFFMIYSMSQCTFLFFMYLDRYMTPPVPYTVVLSGMLLELASLPLINRYIRQPVRSILEIINLQNPVFTLFPILSFFLLAIYGLQDTYQLTNFITLALSITLIFFAYYLTATSIAGARRLQHLEYISMTDSLTGLYNRRYMEKLISQEYDQYLRTGSGFALASADIDFFKNVNDIYGHDIGDTVLRSIADEILGSVRTYDTVARWGGEEFLILLPSTNEHHAMELAERIRKRIEDGRYIPGDSTSMITLTLGVSVITPADTVESLIQRADVALYHGKRESRNCVISFNSIDPAVTADI